MTAADTLQFPFDGVEGLLERCDREDLRQLSLSCASVKGDYVEIGCWYGLSTLCILSGMPAKKRLIVFDFHEPEKVQLFDRNIALAGFSHRRVTRVPGDIRKTLRSTVDDLAIERVRQCARGDIRGTFQCHSAAFVFIDHDHSLANTELAYNTFWPVLSAGGVMVFHDYLHPGFPEPTPFFESLPHKRLVARQGMIAFQKSRPEGSAWRRLLAFGRTKPAEDALKTQVRPTQ